MFGEEGFVGSINGCEVVQIFHKHGGFNDVAHFQACGFDDRFYVIQRLTCLCSDVCRYFARFRIYRDLASGENGNAIPTIITITVMIINGHDAQL